MPVPVFASPRRTPSKGNAAPQPAAGRPATPPRAAATDTAIWLRPSLLLPGSATGAGAVVQRARRKGGNGGVGTRASRQKARKARRAGRQAATKQAADEKKALADAKNVVAVAANAAGSGGGLDLKGMSEEKLPQRVGGAKPASAANKQKEAEAKQREKQKARAAEEKKLIAQEKQERGAARAFRAQQEEQWKKQWVKDYSTEQKQKEARADNLEKHDKKVPDYKKALSEVLQQIPGEISTRTDRRRDNLREFAVELRKEDRPTKPEDLVAEDENKKSLTAHHIYPFNRLRDELATALETGDSKALGNFMAFSGAKSTDSSEAFRLSSFRRRWRPEQQGPWDQKQGKEQKDRNEKLAALTVGQFLGRDPPPNTSAAAGNDSKEEPSGSGQEDADLSAYRKLAQGWVGKSADDKVPIGRNEDMFGYFPRIERSVATAGDKKGFGHLDAFYRDVAWARHNVFMGPEPDQRADDAHESLDRRLNSNSTLTQPSLLARVMFDHPSSGQSLGIGPSIPDQKTVDPSMPDQKTAGPSMPDEKTIDLTTPNAGSSGTSAGAAPAVIYSKPWTSAPTAAFNTSPARYTGYGVSSTTSDMKGISDPSAFSSSGASGGTAASTQPAANSFWSTAHNGAFHSALVRARRDAERTRPYNQNDWKAVSDGKRTQSGAAAREQYLPPEQIGDLKETPRDRQEREQRDRMQLSRGDQREIARLKRALDLSKDKKHG